MVKPRIPAVAIEGACRPFGIGPDRVLISWLDIT